MKANDVARALAARAEAVCRAYLPAGRRAGNYWQVGNVHGHPGQSLYVRLTGPKAGHWTDYVAPEIMLRPGAGRRCCADWTILPQHNVSRSGRVA